MVSISNIKATVKTIKDIIDKSHYTQLNNELKNVIEQSNALDEYINLLTISKLYLSNIKNVVNQLYSLTGDESAFKAKVDQLSSNRTFNYDVIPENSTKQNKIITYTYFDTFSFDIILSILRKVSLAQQTENSQFFLPQSPNSVNEIAQNVTTNYVTAILQERVDIDRHLKYIKSNANKLTVNFSQNTTPTAVANNSIENVNNLVQQYINIKNVYFFEDVNKDLLEINNKFSFTTRRNIIKYQSDINKLSSEIKTFEAYLNLINKYKDAIIKFKSEYTNQSINNTITAVNKRIEILTQLLNIAKGSNKDTKANDLKAASLPTTNNNSNSTSTTTTEGIKSEIALIPDTWGIKFTAGKTFYMDLLPARQSTIPVQGGRDVPNAMPGLNYKLVTQVGKQAIPGFSPVYQNLGIKGMQITIVGAFTGGDGSESTRKTDTPEDNSKTPWLKKSKGSPSLSDNPDRGGNLPELTAYNSYTEFVQLCQQGKHMEVEINLFQVYNQSTTTQIGQDIKLQSKNGNPNFTGIVRSLDVYHATKERTWYTLIMDVTDFGMASKKAINLNNKLEEAIKKAQAELKAAQAAEAAKEANPTSEITDAALAQINNSNLSAEDKIKYKKKLAWFVFLSKEALSNNYVDGSKLEPLMKELQSGRKDNISYIQAIALSNDRVLVKIANKCTFTEEYRKILFLQQNLTLAKLTSSIMSGFIKFSIEKNNRDIFKCENISYFLFGKDVILKEYLMNPNDPTPFKNDSRLTSTSLSELNSLIAQRLNNISGPEIIAIFGKATGCLTAAGLGGAILGGLVGLGTAAVGCINQAGDNVYKAYLNNDPNTQDYNYVKGELFSGDSIREWVTTFATTLTIDAVTAGVGSKLTGGGFRQGISQAYKQGAVYKGGNLFKGKKGSTSSIINSISNVTDDIANILKPLSNDQVLGKVVQSEGVEYTIISLNRTPGLRNVESLLVKDSNGKIKTLNLNQIEALDITLKGSQLTVPTTSINSQSQAAVSSVYTPNQSIPVKGNKNLAKQILQDLKGTNTVGVYSPGLKFKRIGGGTTNVESIIGVTDDAVYINTSLTDLTSTKIPLSSITDIIYPDPTNIKAIQVPVSTNNNSNPVSPSPSIPQQQTTQNLQQPSTGSSSQGSVVTPPVGLTGQALTNFKTLIQFNGKQLAPGKEITISYKRITQEGIVTRQIKSLTYNTKIETFEVLDSKNKRYIIEPSNILFIKLP